MQEAVERLALLIGLDRNSDPLVGAKCLEHRKSTGMTAAT
jgi:hypothetical protein